MIFLQTHLIFSCLLLAVFGLMMGSFFNVVIIRYPVILMREWRADCLEFLKLPAEATQPRYNLAMPGSQCLHCRHSLKWWHNIPLFSYFFLKGRCAFCREAISIQYPLVELMTALLTVAVFLNVGWQFKTLALWIMTWSLIILSGIDWKIQILPDIITLSLLWLGLILNSQLMFVSLEQAVWGAVIGYLLLGGVAGLFKLIRKKQGMGNGDFKMLAMFGAWSGPTLMLHILLIAVLLSVMLTLILLSLKKIQRDQPLPFGPWLALSGWLVLTFEPIIHTGITKWW